MQKKKTILPVLVLALMIVGCSKELSNDCLYLSECELTNKTIQNYQLISDVNETIGETFAVKVLNISKFENDDYTHYIYHILMSPIINKKIQINGIEINPPIELEDFYTKYEQGAHSFKAWNSLFDGIEFPLMKNIEDFNAYEILIVIDDLGTEARYQYGIDKDSFDGLMKSLKLKIVYNSIEKDILELKYIDEIDVYSKEDVGVNKIVDDLIEKGYSSSFMRPYGI